MLWLLLQGGVAGAQSRPATSAPDPQLERERLRWNRSLVHDTAYKFNRRPNALLVATVKGQPPGKALDVGMGQGRNSLFLARQGWQVTGIDVADEAVAAAREQARREKLPLDARVAAMETFDFGTNRYNLVVYVYEGCLRGPSRGTGRHQAGPEAGRTAGIRVLSPRSRPSHATPRFRLRGGRGAGAV
ncbi:class I SAM-dependent methyltransferase [Hymenobacter sp. B81]|uniref:class I SAM-dependent methyltransferase n=1 Tax=Hymenobacter sp. B81 TaxID=3344878 RepID=UPI0037DD62CA